MITAVKIYQNVFKARLSFELFDWLLTEAMLDRQTSFEELKIEKIYYVIASKLVSFLIYL